MQGMEMRTDKFFVELLKADVNIPQKVIKELGELGLLPALIGIGAKIHITNPDEAEKMEYIICLRETFPLMLSDNIIDICVFCGARVQVRPNAPKFPKRCCNECFEAGAMSK
jgi:hypothetical protein